MKKITYYLLTLKKQPIPYLFYMFRTVFRAIFTALGKVNLSLFSTYSVHHSIQRVSFHRYAAPKFWQQEQKQCDFRHRTLAQWKRPVFIHQM